MSVLVPAFNAAATVAAAVRSALAQTVPAMEVLVVDDGSRDDTAAVVAAIAAKDSRVTLMRHEATRGVSAARNTALRAARGEWIAVLDADDRFAPERLETLVASARARGLDIIIDNLLRIDGATGKPIGIAFPTAWMAPPEPIDLTFLMRHDYPGEQDVGFGYCKPIFRTAMLRDQVGGYCDGLQCAEDVLALQQAMFGGARVGTVADALYLYTCSATSLSFRRGAYQTISRVNRQIRQLDRRHGGQMQTLLRARQAEIDYDGLVQSARKREWQEVAYFLRSVPKGRLWRGLRLAALKRLGLRRDASMDRTPIPPMPVTR